jgi:hypothetical protein
MKVLSYLKKITFGIVAVALVAACDGDDEKIVAFDSSYFPLHVGDRWEYESVNVEDPTVYLYITNVIREITGTAVIDGDTYYIVKGSYSYHPSHQREPIEHSLYYRLWDNGFIYTHDIQTGTKGNPYRLGASDGERWKVSTTSGQGVISVDEIETFELGNATVESCKIFYFDIERLADDEHASVLAPGLGSIAETGAWGVNLRLKKATINGQEFEF